jgi:hypothetical protein
MVLNISIEYAGVFYERTRIAHARHWKRLAELAAFALQEAAGVLLTHENSC